MTPGLRAIRCLRLREMRAAIIRIERACRPGAPPFEVQLIPMNVAIAENAARLAGVRRPEPISIQPKERPVSTYQPRVGDKVIDVTRPSFDVGTLLKIGMKRDRPSIPTGDCIVGFEGRNVMCKTANLVPQQTPPTPGRRALEVVGGSAA